MNMYKCSLPFLLISCFVVPHSAQSASIEQIISQMSLQQKVGQLFMVNLFGSGVSNMGRELLQTWQPGAVALAESNIGTPQQVARLTNAFQQTVVDVGGLPMLIAVDQEGGIIERLDDGFTTWPVPMLLTATADPDLAYRFGQLLGQELGVVGINMNLAPIADLQTNVENPIIGRRSFGSDPGAVAVTVAEVVRGMQDMGVVATLKHFPGHGDTDADSHLTLPPIGHDLERLRSIEFPPFQAGVDAGAGAVMVGHLWLTNFDQDDPLPSSLSSAVVGGLLRDELGYTGLVLTDALGMDAIDTQFSYGEATMMALQAGVDMIVFGPNVGEPTQMEVMRSVLQAVEDGLLNENRLELAVARIVEAKARFGVLDWSPLDVLQVSIDLATSSRLIDEMFAKGITLVQDDSSLIPIDDKTEVGIVFPANRNSIRAECSAYSEHIRWLGVSQYPVESEIQSAVFLAEDVDTLLVFTQNAYYREAQQQLVRSLPSEKVIVVALQSPYDILRFLGISSYMVTYSPLASVIPAVCGILFGELPALGNLSVDLRTHTN